MSTINNFSYSGTRNLNVRGGILRFGKTNSTDPLDSLSYGIYVNGSGQLVFSSLGNATVLGSGGGGGGSLSIPYTEVDGVTTTGTSAAIASSALKIGRAHV